MEYVPVLSQHLQLMYHYYQMHYKFHGSRTVGKAHFVGKRLRHKLSRHRIKDLDLGIASSPSDVQSLELVKTGEHTSAGDAAQDVCTSSFHQRHESFIFQNLNKAVKGALVLDASS